MCLGLAYSRNKNRLSRTRSQNSRPHVQVQVAASGLRVPFAFCGEAGTSVHLLADVCPNTDLLVNYWSESIRDTAPASFRTYSSKTDLFSNYLILRGELVRPRG